MGCGCQGRRGRQRIRSPFVMDCGMSNIDRMRDEQLKNEKDEAEGSSFFYRQTRSRNWLSSLNYGKI